MEISVVTNHARNNIAKHVSSQQQDLAIRKLIENLSDVEVADDSDSDFLYTFSISTKIFQHFPSIMT